MGVHTTLAMRTGQLDYIKKEIAGLLQAPVLRTPTQLSVSFETVFHHGLDGAVMLSAEIERLAKAGVDTQKLDDAFMSILNSLTNASHWLSTYIKDLETPPSARS